MKGVNCGRFVRGQDSESPNCDNCDIAKGPSVSLTLLIIIANASSTGGQPRHPARTALLGALYQSQAIVVSVFTHQIELASGNGHGPRAPPHGPTKLPDLG
jgi:hypothetical protein